MSSVNSRSLKEVAGVPDALAAAYQAAVSFALPPLEERAAGQQSVEGMAAQEGTVAGVAGGHDGVTAGLRGILRQRALMRLSSWLEVRRRFDAEIQPFMERIDAVRNEPTKKAAIEQKAAEAEMAIVTEAEANRPYFDSKTAKENADRHFLTLLQGEGGRPVNSFGHTWAYRIILVAITSVEWLINYDAFMAWTGIPAVAAGFTIAMALAVGFAAHVHGEYLKQRGSRFAPHSANKARDFMFLGTMTAMLLIAITVAGWARYSLAMHSISTQGPVIQSEFSGGQQSPLSDVYFSLGINVIVWLIGLVVSYLSHDENHELMEAELERYRRTRRFNRLHRPWEERIKLAKAKATRELEQLKAATAMAVGAIKAQRDMYEQVEKREEDIYRSLAGDLQPLLNVYQITLGRELEARGHNIVVNGNALTGRQYQQLGLDLSPQLLRKLLA